MLKLCICGGDGGACVCVCVLEKGRGLGFIDTRHETNLNLSFPFLNRSKVISLHKVHMVQEKENEVNYI